MVISTSKKTPSPTKKTDPPVVEFSDEEIERTLKFLRMMEMDFGEDMIGKLLDTGSDLERTHSPNIQFVMLYLYLKEGEEYFTKKWGGEILGRVGKNLLKAMVSYKGLRMDKLTDILKKAPENIQVTQSGSAPQQQQDKGSLRDRVFGKKESNF